MHRSSKIERSLTLAGLMLAMPAGTLAQTVLPQGGSVVSGQARINAASSNALTINQNSSRAIVDWNSFSVGSGGSVSFVQPNSSSAILNRVTGSTASTLAGAINANGQVFLVNPNGIAITPSGTVQVGGGFVASTLDIINADFNAGNFSFAGNGTSAAVSNAGTILSSPRGFIGLIGGTVSNSGTISVPLGKVGLGSGEQVTIDPTGDGFLQVALPTGAVAADGRALVDVSGRIKSAGGSIEIKAATAQQAVRDAVNVSGALSARSVSGRSGSIVLGGGDGGTVAISGNLSATGGKRAQGGSVTVTGSTIALRGAIVDVSGGSGGGTVEIGGGPQGSGPLWHAATTSLDQNSTIKADATVNGNGGNVTVWSDDTTDFRGTISATGAATGSGGAVEVSSHGLLGYAGLVDVRAASGKTGTLLLDPYDVTISNGADTNMSGTTSPFSPTGNSSVLSVTTLQNALANANVTVNTGNAGAQNGDITVANAVTWNSGNSLTLSSARDIDVNANITTNGGGLTLSAGRSVNVTGATIGTAGGNLSATASTTDTTNGINLSNATINVGSGTGTLTGLSTNGFGATIFGTSALTASSGSITLSGTTATSTLAEGGGMIFYANSALATAGTITLNGTGGTVSKGHGITLASNATVTSSGSLTLNGVAESGSYDGINFNNNVVTASSGNVSINGTSNVAGAGITVGTGALSLVNNGAGSFSLNGLAASGPGFGFNMGTSITTSGAVSVSGQSTSGSGINLPGGNSMIVYGGNLAVSGTSASGSGIEFAGVNSLGNSGTLALTATSSSGNGVQFDSGASLTTSGAMTLAGFSTTGYGFSFTGSNAITSSSGNLALSGSSSSSLGMELRGTSTVTNNGSGTLTVDAVGGADLGASISSSNGPLELSGSGSINQSDGTIAAANLLLSGASGNFVLNAAGNQIATVAASAASVSVTDGSALTIGSVLGTTGAATTGSLALVTTGDLTIAAGATASGTSPVLAAAGAFINNAGSGAVSAASGRWLVYSNAPASDTFGGLNSGNTAVWDATYASLPPGSVSAAGNRYVFAYQPVLTVTSTSASKLYGADASGAIAANDTITGVQTGVANAYLGDSAAAAYSGAATVTSSGAAPAANVAGSPYAIDVAQGTLTSPANYSFAFQNSGQLTVNPAPVSVTAVGGSSTYGSSPGNPGLSATGLQNGQNAGVLTGLSNSFGISNTSDAGNYTLSVAGALTNANYTVASTTTGTWTVGAAPVSVTALGGSSTYGSSPANPGLSATGLQNGQNVGVLTGLSNSFGISNTSNAGSYTLDVSGALTNANYMVTGTTSGTWTVGAAPVSVTALGGSSTYGSSPANPGFSATGLQNGQNASVLTGLSNSFGISNTSNAGNYALGVTGVLTNANYTVAGNTSGSWIVNPAPVSVTALGGSSIFGSSPANPGLSATGLQNGDAVSVLTGLRNSFGITSSSAVGNYIMDVTGLLTNSNYSVASVTAGSWTVNAVGVTPLRGSSPDGSSSRYIPGSSSPQSQLDSGVLNGLSNLSAAINVGFGNPVAAGRSPAARPPVPDVEIPAPSPNPLPPSLDMPLAIPPPEPLPCVAVIPRPVPDTDCPDNPEPAKYTVAPVPSKEAAPAGFVASPPDHDALLEDMNRKAPGFAGLTTRAKVTAAVATAGLALVSGLLIKLLGDSTFINALLSVMLVWRFFKRVVAMIRRKWRDRAGALGGRSHADDIRGINYAKQGRKS